MHEVLTKVRNVLEECHFVIERYVVEQHQMLMHLSHVTDVRNNGPIEDLCHEAHSEKFADARNSGAVDLNEGESRCFEEVLEKYPIGDVLASGYLHRSDGFRKFDMCKKIIRMGGFLDPERIELRKLTAHP